ncbi:nucleoside-diphosphate-sugar epimerase [Priestia taiwanensis]|uniref:Membrane protein n=2 Tax=Priestia taiwanensis TaxID=1347902 RepID=A0A917AY39_9BACI|nr:nucleoside-diphosphate-sugar epimerase [Priestia taiwanensis]GGE82586.1 membrane protein [Priestia taiwanensis]
MKVLVLGASGGMGYALVKELCARGISVVAFARGKEKLRQLFQQEKLVEIIGGDVFNLEEVEKAAQGVEIIFHAINVPYEEWTDKQPQLLANILHVAKQRATKLVMVDNIYAYGRSNGKKVTEDVQKNPHTKKGKIRLQLEKMAKQSGVDVLICHFPDFYGPHATNTLLHFTLEQIVRNKRAMFVGDLHIAREYIYTPDGARALVELALRNDTYNQNWNIPASDLITGTEIVSLAQEIIAYKKKAFVVKKGFIRMLGMFNKNMREVVEMFYLTEEPVILSGEKYEREIGLFPCTSYQEGIRQTLESIQQQS